MYKLSNIKISPPFQKENLANIVAKTMRLGAQDIEQLQLLRLSLDARKKSDIHYVATVTFVTNKKLDTKRIKNLETCVKSKPISLTWKGEKKKIVIVFSS